MKTTMLKTTALLAAAILASSLSACASYDNGHGSRHESGNGASQYDNRYRTQGDQSPPDHYMRDESHYGTVSDIEVIRGSERSSGGGAILGAILGAAIGHQVGDGTGRKVATGAGAVAGAVIGNNIERRNNRDGEIFRVRVRMNDGREFTAEYRSIGDLEIRDRVRIDDGQIYRM